METKNNAFVADIDSKLKAIADKHLPTYKAALLDKTADGIDATLEAADRFNTTFNAVYKRLRESGYTYNWIRENEDMVVANLLDSIKCNGIEKLFEGIDMEKMARHHVSLKTELDEFMIGCGLAVGVLAGFASRCNAS